MKVLVFLEHHGDALEKGGLGVLSKAASLGDAMYTGLPDRINEVYDIADLFDLAIRISRET